MFVGFIAVVVVLLIIIAVMSTGTTSGSGGVDQTKAAKMVTELSSLAQTSGFYKTTTEDNDYTGVSVDALKSAGIVANEDVETIADDDDTVKNDAGTAVHGDVIKSKAVAGLYYTVTETANADGTANGKGLIIDAITDTDIIKANSTLAAALERAYTKFGTGGDITDADPEGAVNVIEAGTEADPFDGANRIVFK